MQRRDFGSRSGFQVPRANIGAMRLPEDVDEAVALVRRAIDAGMTYIDTCRWYGDSELKLARALKDGYRAKVILSTKWAPWIRKVEESDDASAACTYKRIRESMHRLEVEYLDFYQVWNISSPEHYEAATRPGGMVDGIRRAMDEGLVGHTGFTSHDKPENLIRYFKEAKWCEVVLLSCNLLNRTYAPVIAAAHEQGIGTIVMNPVGGGRLAEASPVLLELAEKVGARSVPDLAIRFLMSDPALDTIIAGLHKASDVADVIASVEAGPFTAAQMGTIAEFLATIEGTRSKLCTGCKYCLPCPQGIDIPAVMNLIADDRLWGFRESATQRYRAMKTPGADACARCGQCVEKCTQKLEIMDEMEWAAGRYGK